jgi:integrase
MSARSVEAVHKTVKAAYALAVNKGQLVRNPAALATPPAAAEPKHSWYTPEQVGAFLSFVAGLGDKSPLPHGLIDALVDTGGRRGEVLALRWADIDLEAGTAQVTRQLVAHPKTKRLEVRPTKRPRSKSVIGLHPETEAALRQRRAQQSEARLKMGAGWPRPGSLDADLVFTFNDGRAIHPDTLTNIIGRLSERSGLGRLTPHGLRHAFASAALAARVPVEVVAARLGNTPRVVQEVYSHVIPADDQAAAQLVGDLYRRNG